jgi:hypothetical protein
VLAFASALALLLGSLHGTVMRGPTTPVCRVGVPCEEPAAQVTLLFSRNGTSKRSGTDRNGRYRLRLAPGVYSVRTDQRPFGTMPRPASVRVRAGRDIRVDFDIDTGIR